jgi:hypothetical protein
MFFGEGDYDDAQKAMMNDKLHSITIGGPFFLDYFQHQTFYVDRPTQKGLGVFTVVI